MVRLDITLGSIGTIGGDCLKGKWYLHVGESADLKSAPGNDDSRRKGRLWGLIRGRRHISSSMSALGPLEKSQKLLKLKTVATVLFMPQVGVKADATVFGQLVVYALIETC